MNIKAYAIGATLLLAIAIGLTSAQQVSKPNQDIERIVTASNLVTINVIVTDQNGRYVKGLSRDQFEVFDEKVKQQIAHFTDHAAPVSLGIICEIHDSIPERTGAILTALKQFTDTLRSEDDFFFTAFGKAGSVTSDFVPAADQVLGHLATVRPGGSSALYDAVHSAAERLRNARHLKKALLIVSDGWDDRSRTTYQQLRDRLREFDVQVYAIVVADPATDPQSGYGRWVFEDLTRQSGRRAFLWNAEAATGRAVLAEMARVSGGVSYFPETENEPELVGICLQIATELRQQYTLGFYPNGRAAMNDWHRIRVKVNTGSNRRLVLSYRRGYRLINERPAE